MSISPSQKGGLIVTSKISIPETLPIWCSFLDQPTVHYITLLWMPHFEESPNASDPGSYLFASPTFNMGEPWLKANLIISKKETESYPTLYLKLPSEYDAQVSGMAKVAIQSVQNLLTTDTCTSVRWENFSECLFVKSNGQCNNGWMLHPIGTQYSNRLLTSIIRVAVEFVIFKNANGFLLQGTKVMDDFHALQIGDNPEGLGTDVILKNGDTELGAHKFILSARSSVFKAMLAADMAEARSGVIELKHMSVKASQDFLGFIYSGSIDRQRLLETAEELLQVATMYDMPDLKVGCEAVLRGVITACKTAQFLVLSSLHDARTLKADTLAFLASNKTAVTATEEWAEAMAVHSKVLLETILEII